MTELFPKFKATDPHARVGGLQDRRDARLNDGNGDGEQRILLALFLSGIAYAQA